MFFEHIVAYVFGVFRKWEISKKGKPDVNGVIRAPKELVLQSVEVFFDCLLTGFVIKHMLSLTYEQFHMSSYMTYWIIIDCILMFTTQLYNFMGNLLKVKSEIQKNIYTLHFIQTFKLTYKKEEIYEKIRFKMKKLILGYEDEILER